MRVFDKYKNMIIQFMLFGMLGWCMEVVWTGLGSAIKRDFRLVANTSIWMFFIYGLAAFLGPIARLVAPYPLIFRGGVYVICIFAAEYITGSLLKHFGICPWDYSKARLNINGVIRLDYAPVWFAVGLIMEQMIFWLE